MKRLLSFCAFLLLALPAIAQNIPDGGDLFAVNLHMSARNYGDSVVLRWGMNSSGAWPYINQAGYTIERLAMTDKNTPIDNTWKVLADSVKPWPLSAIGTALAQPEYKNDDYFKLAAGMLYGTDAPATGGQQVPHNMGDELKASDSKFSFALLGADLSPRAAAMLGLRFTDRTVRPGQRYLYRIRVAGTPGGFHADTTAAFVDMAAVYIPEAPGSLTALPAEHRVNLSWHARQLGQQFTAYWIERSADGSNFSRLTTKPYLMMRGQGRDPLQNNYSDSLPDNSHSYYYRVAGIDAFGQVSPYTPAIKAGGADRTFAMNMLITNIQRGAKGKATIQWTATNPPADLLGFYIYTKQDPDEPFTQVSAELPASARSFVDTGATGAAYYLVAAFDTAGNVATSESRYTFVPDSIPPAIPTGLAGSIDTAGTVTLHWPAGADRDIRGYRIYAANQADHQFTPILEAPIDDTTYSFKTTLHTLTKHIYFKIVAVDASGNHSPQSAMLMLTRPDKVPPTAPVIADYLVTDSAVTIRWNRSSSHDVASQQLYRRAAGTTGWTLIASPDATAAQYNDRTVKGGQELEYALTATDSSGLRSGYSFPLRARVYTVAPPAAISNLKAVVDKGNIRLTWQASTAANAIIIARSYNGSGYVPVIQLSGKETSWTDALLIGNGSYQYRIQQVTPDGSKTDWVSAAPATVSVQ